MGVWIWLVVAAILLVMWESDPDTLIRLFLVGLAALGGWIAFRSLRRLRSSGSGPALLLSSDEVMVGQPFTLRGGATGATGLTARLICRESASYKPPGQSQSATDVQDWVVQEVAGRPPGQGAPTVLELAIPSDGMHSFRSAHCRIEWRVEVDVGFSGDRRPDRVDLPVTVLPAVHEQ